MAKGYFKIWRSLIEDPIFLHSTPAQIKVLIAILSIVSWKERKWDDFGHKFVIKPGQIYISTRDLAKLCGDGITRDLVRSALKRFEKLGFLTQHCPQYSAQSKTLITVVNWDKYQGSDNGTPQYLPQYLPQYDPSTTPARPQHDPTIKEEGKKERKKEGKKKKIISAQDAHLIFEIYSAGNLELLSSLDGWAEVRIAMGQMAPFTEQAVKTCLENLDKLSNKDKAIAKKIVDESVMNGWRGFFPLSTQTLPQKKATSMNDYAKAFMEENQRSANKNGDHGKPESNSCDVLPF